MAEYIEREALLAAYDAAHKGEPGGARKLIADAPAADVVAVVRCKDCKHRNRIGSGFPWCDAWEADLFSDEGFCSYGEQKDGE